MLALNKYNIFSIKTKKQIAFQKTCGHSLYHFLYIYIIHIFYVDIYSSSDKYESHDKKGKLNLITSIRKHYIHVNILLQPKKISSRIIFSFYEKKLIIF